MVWYALHADGNVAAQQQNSFGKFLVANTNAFGQGMATVPTMTAAAAAAAAAVNPFWAASYTWPQMGGGVGSGAGAPVGCVGGGGGSGAGAGAGGGASGGWWSTATAK